MTRALSRPAATGAVGAIGLARSGRRRFVEEPAAFCRSPSVRSRPEHEGDLRRRAGWPAGHLRAIGLERVAIRSASGAPVVTADWRRRPGRPTVLIYGHYDVQPAETAAGRRPGPLRPAVVGDPLVARGSADDVAPLACRHAFGRPPAMPLSGGMIEAVAMLARRGVAPVLLGPTPPDARVHPAGELLHLTTFFGAAEAAIWFLAGLGGHHR